MTDVNLLKTIAYEKFALRGEFDPTADPAATFGAGWDAVIEACGGTDHLLKVGPGEWHLQHPITERLEGTLFDCELHALVAHLVWKGRFPQGMTRLWKGADGQWHWADAD